MSASPVPDVDQILSILPIHLSNSLTPGLQIHQFPLLTRPLQVPPSAAQSGKQIKARLKPNAGRLEIHVPVDTRQEVWNKERSRELGKARADDDIEKGLSDKGKQRETDDYRLSEIRLQSEQIPDRGTYMLGVVRDGNLHLHPISETHQLRPTMTYIDILMRKNTRRSRTNDESDADSDEGPPPDPDEAPPVPVKKDKKAVGEAKEVQVAIKKVEDKGGQQLQGGLSAVRREMLLLLREEDEEKWEDIEYFDGETEEAANAFEALFSHSDERLTSQNSLLDVLQDIHAS